MKKRKKLINIITIFLVLLAIGVIVVLNYKNKINERNDNRYAEIKKDVQLEVDRYVRVKHYCCNPIRVEAAI